MGRNDIYDTPPMRAALGLYAFRQDAPAEWLTAAGEAALQKDICRLPAAIRDEEDNNDAD